MAPLLDLLPALPPASISAMISALIPAMAPSFMAEGVALIAACAAIAYVCQRLRLVPIVGFLLAGVVLGPNALGLVNDLEVIDAVAEVGVILLLFTIGIEFSLEKLARIQRFIFLGGGLQIGLCVTAATLLLLAVGVPLRSGIYTGCLIALSSTAIVLKILADRAETNSSGGLVALGVLIFQDLAVIVMVLLVPLLGGMGGTPAELLWALAKAGLLIALVLLVARRIMPRLLEAVARTCSPELFLLTVVTVCFGTAWATSLAGVSVSLGAFMAGLLVSESRFSEHALGEILPLRILFSAAFFVSVGLLLDLSSSSPICPSSSAWWRRCWSSRRRPPASPSSASASRRRWQRRPACCSPRWGSSPLFWSAPAAPWASTRPAAPTSAPRRSSPPASC